MIPLDVILAPTLIDAVIEWRKPRWQSVAPYPGLKETVRAWREGAPLREGVASVQAENEQNGK